MFEDEGNEFDNLNVEEDQAPAQTFSETPNDSDSMISAGSTGTSYDWSKAPIGAKAPARVNLEGQTVTIAKADIILPPADREWQKSRTGNAEYKYCTFVLHYEGGDNNIATGQQEFFSGVRLFPREENGQKKYSHPTIMRDRKNQASELLGLYADFKGKDITQVSLREFMGFLNSAPKAVIKKVTVTNPATNATLDKNLIEKFV